MRNQLSLAFDPAICTVHRRALAPQISQNSLGREAPGRGFVVQLVDYQHIQS